MCVSVEHPVHDVGGSASLTLAGRGLTLAFAYAFVRPFSFMIGVMRRLYFPGAAAFASSSYESESTPIPLTPSTPPSGGLRYPVNWPLRTRRGSDRPTPVYPGTVVYDLRVLEQIQRRLVTRGMDRACTSSDLTRSMSDSMAALSHGEDIEPIEGRMSCLLMVLESSSNTYCEPWSLWCMYPLGLFLLVMGHLRCLVGQLDHMSIASVRCSQPWRVFM